MELYSALRNSIVNQFKLNIMMLMFGKTKEDIVS